MAIERRSCPILISADQATLEPCSRADDCTRWASGKITVKQTGGAWAVLAAAGCETCGSEPVISRDDRNALFLEDKPFGSGPESAYDEAAKLIAERVMSLHWFPGEV